MRGGLLGSLLVSRGVSVLDLLQLFSWWLLIEVLVTILARWFAWKLIVGRPIVSIFGLYCLLLSFESLLSSLTTLFSLPSCFGFIMNN